MHPLLKIILLSVLLKCLYLLIGLGHFHFQNKPFPQGGLIEIYSDFTKKKDSHWYENITKQGYPKGQIQSDKTRLLDFSKGQSAWAFFPLYPFLHRLTMELTGCNYEIIAVFWSIIFSTLAFWGFYLFSNHYWQDSKKAIFATLLFACCPFQFYFSMQLTEAIFAAALLFSFVFLQRQSYFFSMICTIPLVLTRPNGLVILFPFWLFFLEKNGIVFSNFFTKANCKKIVQSVTICLPSVLIFALYCGYQHAMTGHYFAFGAAQNGWGKSSTFPLFALFKQGNISYQLNSWYTIFALLCLIFYWRKLPLSLALLVLISILLPLAGGSVYGMFRYVSVLFPLFLCWSDTIYAIRHRFKIVAFLLLWQLWIYIFWLENHPIGY